MGLVRDTSLFVRIGQAMAACLLGLVGGIPAPAGEAAILTRRAELPVVIPHPQRFLALDGQDILLGEHGRIAIETILPTRGGFFDEAASLIQSALRKHGLTERSECVATRIVLQTVAAAKLGSFPELTPQQSAALAKSDQAYVIRVEPGPAAKVWVIGASPLGTHYGATTLVQLFESPRPGTVVLRPIEVADYPDTPLRMSADWVLQWDWEVNCYDWGDGLAAFLDRCKRKIDLCSQYKVNRVRFLGGRIAPGPSYTRERYERIKRFGLELNRYARRKGVTLQYSSSSFGIDYYGWGLPYPQPWILNRERYPDGPVYSCVGGTVGGCLSNDALIRIIADRHKQLVRDLEPGSIYLHQIDAAAYAELVRLWKTRCPRCRQRFPDDEPCAPRGYAAAVAHLYNTIVAELKSVKNPQSGYDASRDLEIVFASPGYSYSTESDSDWEKDLKYFAEIGRQLTDKRNVQITFREQFNRLDERGLRIREMAAALEQAGWPRAPFVFAVQGGGFLMSSRMFVSSPVLTGIDEGANTLYNFNGHVHSELQVLANVNYAWNRRAPGWVDPLPFRGRALQDEASRYAVGARHSDFLYGRFLESACAALYGKQAAPSMVALFRLERDRGPILAVPAWIDHQWKNAGFDWRAQAERNLRAKRLVENALAICDVEAKADLAWLAKCLEVAARLCRLCDAVHREKRPKTEVEALAADLSAWLDKNFQFQVTEPDGGDPGLWKALIARIAGGQVQAPAPGSDAGDRPSWPEFHGPGRTNISPDKGLLKKWPEAGPPLVWKYAPCGVGYSGVAIARGMIFTAGDFGDTEMLLALDMEGKLLWKSPNGGAWTGASPGSRTTPTYNDGSLYHMNPNGRLAAYEPRSGKQLWAIDLKSEFDSQFGVWGLAENVIVDGDKVLCMPGGPKARVVALDKRTGRTLWANTEIEHSAAYCSPLVVTYRGVRQLITMTQKSVAGVDVETGRLVWSAPFVPRSPQNALTPVFQDGYVFVACGHWSGGTVLKIDPETRTAATVWYRKDLDNCHGGAILVDGKLFGCGCRQGGKNFYCVDFLTGKTVKLDNTLGKVGISYADGMLYCLNHRGTMSLLAVTPDGFDIVSQFDLGKRPDNTYLAHPVICGGRLYLRCEQELRVYDIRAK